VSGRKIGNVDNDVDAALGFDVLAKLDQALFMSKPNLFSAAVGVNKEGKELTVSKAKASSLPWQTAEAHGDSGFQGEDENT